jgi:hypothetical protein
MPPVNANSVSDVWSELSELGPQPSQPETTKAVHETIYSLESRTLKRVPFAANANVGIGSFSENDREAAEQLLASRKSVEAIIVEVRGGWAEPGDLVTIGLAADEDEWGECAVIVHHGKVLSLTLPEK